MVLYTDLTPLHYKKNCAKFIFAQLLISLKFNEDIIAIASFCFISRNRLKLAKNSAEEISSLKVFHSSEKNLN